ncbi:MAG: GGDEF domain-containing protein, partial [Clostridia bacterium]|nr:GGDEF domain-containing protein [Clostridia bacterium]
DHLGGVLLIVIIIAALIAAAWRSHKVAFADSLTGFGNKRSYLDMTNQLEAKIREGKADFAVAVFDLNGLKNINDSYGHEFGDMAIKDLSKMLGKTFENAHLYRFGGDEFIAISKNSTLEEMRQRFAQLDLELERAGHVAQPYGIPLSVAKGAAVFIPETDTSYSQVFDRADREMYDDKRVYYETHGDRRRS